MTNFSSNLTVIILLSLIRGSVSVLWNQKSIDVLFPSNFPQQLLSRGVVSSCSDRFLKFVEDLKNNQSWAKWIIDSWGTGPAGLYSQQSRCSYGHFDQCIEFFFYNDEGHVAPAKYVLIEASLDDKQFDWGVCLPYECSDSEVQDLMVLIASNMGLKFVQIQGQRMKNMLDWSGEEIGVGVFVALMLMIVGFSSIYDLICRDVQNPVLTAFSLVSNIREMFQPRSSQTFTFLDGLRSISYIQIVFYHVFKCGTGSPYNGPEQYFLINKPAYFLINASDFAVDTFLVVSGLLLSYQFMTARRKSTPFNAATFYLKRIIRLFPSLLAMDLVLYAFIRRLNGPNPDLAYGMYYDIFFHFTYEARRPLYHLWYVITEMKLYLISPLILFPLWKWGYKLFPTMLGLITSAVLFYKYRLDNDDAFDFEHGPIARCTPWLIGIMLGYVIFRKRSLMIKTTTSLATLFVSGITLVMLLVVMYLKRSLSENNCFTVTIHTVWGLLISWPIYAMAQGNHSSFSWILSHPMWQVISKLSYCAFLWHIPLMNITISLQRTPEFVNGFLKTQMSLAITMMSLLVALPWSLIFEAPFINLGRIDWVELFHEQRRSYIFIRKGRERN